MGFGLDDVVNADAYSDKDLVRYGDLVTSKYDIGQGKFFTGAVHATYLTAAGVMSGAVTSFADALYRSLPLASPLLYDPLFVWASLASGIGFSMGNTNKQKIIPGVAVLGLIGYSGYSALNTLGVPSYYLATGAALTSGVTLGFLASALAPVAAVFGAGWALGYFYKRYIKGRKARKEKKEK